MLAPVIESNADTPTVLSAKATTSVPLSTSAKTPTVIKAVGSPAITGQSPGLVTVPFQWNNVTLLRLASIPAGKVILRVDVCMTQAINGMSPSLSIGVPGDYESIVDAGSIDAASESTFSSHPGLSFDVDTTIYLKIDHGIGASQGAGVVSIFLQQ